MSSGRIVQIIGAVIDVEFDRGDVPKVYDALTVSEKTDMRARFTGTTPAAYQNIVVGTRKSRCRTRNRCSASRLSGAIGSS